MNIKSIRTDKVIVDIPKEKEKPKEAFKETDSGIFIPEEQPKQNRSNVEVQIGEVKFVGTDKEVEDIKVGDKVLIKKFQGERLVEDKELFLFKGRDIIGFAE